MPGGETVPAQNIENTYSEITRHDFPDNFFWGTATSAYQVEGGAAKGGRGISVWDVFTLRTPAKIADGSNGNEACDMYTKYKEDIKMMKSLGFNSYRFSISWPRILPGGKISLGINREGIEYYNDLIDTLLANKIEPFVTLFHWDLPYTLEQEYGGFLSENIADDFRDFAELCFWEFGDRVKHWITLNEPWTYCVRGYVYRDFPPGLALATDLLPPLPIPPTPAVASTAKAAVVSRDAVEETPRRVRHNFIPYRGFNREAASALNFVTYSIHDDDSSIYDRRERSFVTKSAVMHAPLSDEDSKKLEKLAKAAYTAARNMLLAHAKAVQSYKTKFQGHQEGEIGITLVTNWFESLTDTDEDKKAAKRCLDFMLGWFLEPVLIGQYPQNMTTNVPGENLKPFSLEESNLLKGSIDFLGLNYYTASHAHNDPNPSVKTGYYRDQKAAHNTPKGTDPLGLESPIQWLRIVPTGIYKLLKYIQQDYSSYNMPIYITENGLADKKNHKLTAYEVCRDQMRVNYYRDHLANIRDAIKEGVKVKGYFAWSWCDNFEWADGYEHRFGIVYVDYVNHLKRYPKDSAMWFAKFLVKKKKEEENQNKSNQQNSNPNRNQGQVNANPNPSQKNQQNPNPNPNQDQVNPNPNQN